MPVIKTPVIKRPAFWTFLGSTVAVGSVYFVQGKVDPILLIDFLQALLALIGISAAGKLGYDKYQAWKEAKND